MKLFGIELPQFLCDAMDRLSKLNPVLDIKKDGDQTIVEAGINGGKIKVISGPNGLLDVRKIELENDPSKTHVCLPDNTTMLDCTFRDAFDQHYMSGGKNMIASTDRFRIALGTYGFIESPLGGGTVCAVILSDWFANALWDAYHLPNDVDMKDREARLANTIASDDAMHFNSLISEMTRDGILPSTRIETDLNDSFKSDWKSVIHLNSLAITRYAHFNQIKMSDFAMITVALNIGTDEWDNTFTCDYGASMALSVAEYVQQCITHTLKAFGTDIGKLEFLTPEENHQFLYVIDWDSALESGLKTVDAYENRMKCKEYKDLDEIYRVSPMCKYEVLPCAIASKLAEASFIQNQLIKIQSETNVFIPNPSDQEATERAIWKNSRLNSYVKNWS